ncbi:MAG: hypothetical protein K5636_07635 [Bacteroidales bacterium]|nr:hypothetical protein [Bacteroidales bacterium]
MKKRILYTIIVACAIVLGGCAMAQFANLRHCTFEMGKITDIKWADINLSNVNSVADLSVTNMTKALTALKNKDFVVSCTVNVKTKNATDRLARLIGYDYELFLEDKLVATGSSKDTEYVINPHTTTTIPVPVNIDLVNVIKKKEIGDIINCIRNLNDKGTGKDSNVKVKFTPYASTGKKTVPLAPITLKKTISSN